MYTCTHVATTRRRGEAKEKTGARDGEWVSGMHVLGNKNMESVNSWSTVVQNY